MLSSFYHHLIAVSTLFLNIIQPTSQENLLLLCRQKQWSTQTHHIQIPLTTKKISLKRRQATDIRSVFFVKCSPTNPDFIINTVETNLATNNPRALPLPPP